jgi:hypothetical protein
MFRFSDIERRGCGRGSISLLNEWEDASLGSCACDTSKYGYYIRPIHPVISGEMAGVS